MINDVPDYNPYASPQTETVWDAPTLESGIRLATRGERLGGAMIDGVLLLLIVLPVSLGLSFWEFGAVSLFVDEWDSATGSFTWASIMAELGGLLLGVVAFLILNGYLLAKRGQTLGKSMLRMRIVSETTGHLLPFGRLLLKRYLSFWLLSCFPGIGNFVTLIDSLAIFRANHKCLHDDFAGTVVVKEP
jgi:uncharacterized RDD family membrane protein YckC